MTDSGEYQIDNVISGTYVLHEQSAPAGYVISNNDFYFTVDAQGETAAVELTVPIAPNATAEGDTLTVENEPGAALPNTGSTGTTAYTASGLALIALAGLLALARRRRAAR